MDNKRLWTRLIAEGKGNFLTKDRDISGAMSLNNYSRTGFRASLNRAVEPGSNLVFEVDLPKHDMRIWATGKVIWAKSNVANNDDRFEAGVELNEIDLFDIKQVPEECYKDKYLEQAANYAFEIGLHTKKAKENFFNTSCSMGALFFIYFLLGSLFAIINPFFAFSHAITLCSYFLFVIYKKRRLIFSNKFEFKLLFRKKTLLRIAGIVLNNICCGLYFILGFIAKEKNNLQNI